jgi:hypothetical protein
VRCLFHVAREQLTIRCVSPLLCARLWLWPWHLPRHWEYPWADQSVCLLRAEALTTTGNRLDLEIVCVSCAKHSRLRLMTIQFEARVLG